MEPTDFEKRTREVLDQGTARLDGRILSRLTQARHAALDQAQRPARHWWRISVPAGAAAAVAVLAIMMWTGQQTPVTEATPLAVNVVSPLDDLEFLTDADAPEFVADGEDLEFYEWAADEMES